MGVFCIKSLALSLSRVPLLDVSVVDALLFKFPNENEFCAPFFASKLPNEKVGATLVAVPAFDPNEKPLFEAVAVVVLLPKVNCDLGGTVSDAVAAPPAPSFNWSQHPHLDFESSFRLKHAEHSQVVFCFSTIDLNDLSRAGDVLDVALVDDVGILPKLNVGFGNSALLSMVAFLAAFGFDPPQQAHLLCV